MNYEGMYKYLADENPEPKKLGPYDCHVCGKYVKDLPAGAAQNWVPRHLECAKPAPTLDKDGQVKT